MPRKLFRNPPNADGEENPWPKAGRWLAADALPWWVRGPWQVIATTVFASIAIVVPTYVVLGPGYAYYAMNAAVFGTCFFGALAVWICQRLDVLFALAALTLGTIAAADAARDAHLVDTSVSHRGIVVSVRDRSDVFKSNYQLVTSFGVFKSREQPLLQPGEDVDLVKRSTADGVLSVLYLCTPRNQIDCLEVTD